MPASAIWTSLNVVSAEFQHPIKREALIAELLYKDLVEN
jgi:hypothetical protein